jgi:hypothetical protein
MIGVLILPTAQGAQHVHAAHVGQVQVQQDEVVVVDLAQIDAFLAQVGRVDVEPSDFSISSMLCAVALSSSINSTRIRLSCRVPRIPPAALTIRLMHGSALTCPYRSLRPVNGAGPSGRIVNLI